MTYDTLPDFLAAIEDDGELVRVAVEVDPVLEVAEIVDRLSKTPGGGPAVLFEKVRGHSIPVVANLLGSERRMCRALRADSLDDVAAQIAGLIQPELPEGWLDALRLVPQFTQLTKLPPKVVRSGICQQVVRMGRDVNLYELPVPHCWPGDSGPLITAGQVYVRSLSGVRHVGVYPLEVRGRDSLFVHWNPHQQAAHCFSEYGERRQPMPVAVTLGGDPACLWAATAPLPPATDPLLLAGLLRQQNVELVRCRSLELDVPAQAEVIIEGIIDGAAELELAGPVSGAHGFYALPEQLPRMQVTAITHRSNPVFPAVIPGRPPTEETWLANAVQRAFLPLVRLYLPEIEDLHLPASGAGRNLLFVSIRKRYPQQARKVMNALWGLNWLMTSKIVVVVEADVDVQDESAVWFHVGANCHPGRDVLFNEGPTHWQDHAAPVRGLGHKMGIDATRKLPDEGHPRAWPEPLQTTPEMRDLVTGRWPEYGITKST